MKKLSRKIVAVLGALSIMALAPGPTMAQSDRVPCPNPLAPVTMTRGGTTTATPDGADFAPGTSLSGMAYGQTADNQPFRDTFVFRKPSTKLCCQFDTLPRTGFYGKLTVRYKALDEGDKGSSTSYNDSGGLVHLGSSVPGQSGWIYPQGSSVSFHQVATHVYYLSAAIVQSGKVSFSVQDDSANIGSARRLLPAADSHRERELAGAAREFFPQSRGNARRNSGAFQAAEIVCAAARR